MNPLDYFKEMGCEVYEDEHGWANYTISETECYIENIYVKEEARRSGRAFMIGDKISEIARERGCKYLVGSTNTKRPHAERSMIGLLTYGMKLLSSHEDVIFFYKEL